MNLVHTPHQSHQPPPIALSQDKHALVTQEVQELLIKGAIVETIPSPVSFVSQIFLVKKKRGGTMTSDQFSNNEIHSTIREVQKDASGSS